MTPQEMIERYIYEVVRRLPAKQRDDTGRELRSLIDDMLEERGKNGKTRQENAADALRELGAPSVLAGKYRDDKKYLIGPAYFEQYWFVLKIVLIAVTLGMVVAAIVQGVVWGYETPVAGYIGDVVTMVASGIAGAAGNVILGLVQGFAWVTIIFAVIERCSVKIDIREATAGAWKPEDLADKPVPAEKAMLKKGDSIAGIVFTVAVVILFNFVPYLMSIWLTGPDGSLHFVPLFNLGVLKTMLPLFNVCFALGIIREALRVAVGRHTLWLGIVTVILNMAALGLACIVFFDPHIWNPDLVSQAAAVNANFAEAAPQLNMFWGCFTQFFGCILIFAFVLDSALSLYKGIRYGK